MTYLLVTVLDSTLTIALTKCFMSDLNQVFDLIQFLNLTKSLG